jgi:hypothetical protein
MARTEYIVSSPGVLEARKRDEPADACVKTFPLAGGDVKELIVSGKDAGPVDWPPLAPLVLHKEEWFAAIDRAIVRIRAVLDRPPNVGPSQTKHLFR